MLLTNVVALFEVCDRAGNLEDPVVGAGREPETVGDEFEKAVAGCIAFTVLANEARP